MIELLHEIYSNIFDIKFGAIIIANKPLEIIGEYAIYIMMAQVFVMMIIKEIRTRERKVEPTSTHKTIRQKI